MVGRWSLCTFFLKKCARISLTKTVPTVPMVWQPWKVCGRSVEGLWKVCGRYVAHFHTPWDWLNCAHSTSLNSRLWVINREVWNPWYWLIDLCTMSYLFVHWHSLTLYLFTDNGLVSTNPTPAVAYSVYWQTDRNFPNLFLHTYIPHIPIIYSL